jgi:hypothetical protein
MKTYYESGNFKVQDHKDQEFAKYTVTNTNRCFSDLNEAVLYCIGASKGKSNDSRLMAYVDTFMTMINK